MLYVSIGAFSHHMVHQLFWNHYKLKKPCVAESMTKSECHKNRLRWKILQNRGIGKATQEKMVGPVGIFLLNINRFLPYCSILCTITHCFLS